MESKKPLIKICPRCGSRKVRMSGYRGHIYDNTDNCLTCGFSSPSFPRIPYDEAKKLPVEMKNFTYYSKPVKKSTRIVFLLIIIFLIMLLLLWTGGLLVE